MAWRDVTALQLAGRDDDPVPPQERDGIGLGQRMPLESAHNPGALALIGCHRLPNEERVEKAILRAGKVYGRQIAGHILGQLHRWIVIEISGEIECHIEISAIDELLPFPDVEPLLR